MSHIIHLGDSLDFMRAMDAASVDAVITDPPYCSGAATEAKRSESTHQGLRSHGIKNERFRWFTADNMTTPGLVWLLRSMAFESERVLVQGGSLIVFCDWRMWSNLAPALESGGLRLQGMIVWDKGSMGLGVGFRPQHELAIHLCKGQGSYHAKDVPNVIGAKRVRSQDRDHPTQKPIDLMRELVRVVSSPGGTVLDPFCGSGSTGVACAIEGRRFIGIDRDPGFVEVARQRIDAIGAQRSLFTEGA